MPNLIKCCWIALSLSFITHAVTAQTTQPTTAPANQLTARSIEQLAHQVKANTQLTADQQKKAEELITKLHSFVSERNKQRQEANQTAAFINQAPEQLANLHTQSTRPIDPKTWHAEFKPMPDDQLQTLIKQLQLELNNLETQIENNRTELESLVARPREIEQHQTEINRRLQVLDAQGPTKATSVQLAQLNRLMHLAERQTLQARANALRQERQSLPLRRQLLDAQIRADRRAAQPLNDKLDLAEAILRKRRETVAQQRYQSMAHLYQQGKKADWPVFMLQIAEQNKTYAKDLINIGKLSNTIAEEINQIEKRGEQLKALSTKTRQQVEQLGLTHAAGIRLRRIRRNLFSAVDLQIAVERRSDILNRILEKQSTLEEARDSVDAIRTDALEQLKKLDLKPNMFSQLDTQLDRLLDDQEQLQNELSIAYEHFLKDLDEQSYSSLTLLRQAQRFRNFIDQYLLWTQSDQPLTFSDLPRLTNALYWLFDPAGLMELAKSIQMSLATRWPGWLAIIGLIVAHLLIRRWVNRQQEKINQSLGHLREDRIGKTLAVAGLSVLKCIALPLAIYLLAWQLRTLPQNDPLLINWVHAIAGGIAFVVLPVAMVMLAVNILSPGGLAIRHFKWNAQACASLVRILMISAWPVLALAMLTAILNLSPEGRSTMGRLLFIINMLIMALAMAWAGHPRSVLVQSMQQNMPDNWRYQSRYIWCCLLTATPLALATVAYLGYYYSALQLGANCFASLAVIIGLIVLESFANRWQQLNLRKLEIDRRRAEQQAEIQRQTQQQHADAYNEQQALPDLVDDGKLDMQEIGEQTRALIGTVLIILGIVGLWWIWADDLPALQMLDEVHLWSFDLGVDAKTGQPLVDHVNLKNLLYCLLTLGATVLLVKNLPGMLETFVLQRLGLDAGSRYAFTLMARYAITAIGIAWALGEIHIGWESVQWLVAAMTVGIAFGLQEIIANFVSGIIILFERPVRLGDTVTVGSTSGKITRIRIRSTTITDWDRKELIVPNKTFLTEKIVNWSLSDQIGRAVISVGIDYDDDPRLAEKILTEVAVNHPEVLDDPGPSVVFTNFGASSLDFDLRIFAPNSDRVRICHELRLAINDRFKEAGLSIPFDQQDVHLDTGDKPLSVRILDNDLPDTGQNS